MTKEVIEIKTQEDVLKARKRGRDMCKDMGFGSADQTRVATAISEIVRNVLKYAGIGFFEIEDLSDDQINKLFMRVVDHGPGIADLDLALSDGFTTGGGLGAGLPGARRLVHEFNIESKPGLTIVSMALKKDRI